MLFAWRDRVTGRWAVDYPPANFSERMSDAHAFSHPGIFEYAVMVLLDDTPAVAQFHAWRGQPEPLPDHLPALVLHLCYVSGRTS